MRGKYITLLIALGPFMTFHGQFALFALLYTCRAPKTHARFESIPLKFLKNVFHFQCFLSYVSFAAVSQGCICTQCPLPVFFSNFCHNWRDISGTLTPICLHTAVLKDSSPEFQWPTVNAAEIQYAASLLYCHFYTSLHCIERHNLFAFLLSPIWHRSFSDASSLMTGSTCLCTASGIGYFRNLKIMLNFYIENKATAT